MLDSRDVWDQIHFHGTLRRSVGMSSSSQSWGWGGVDSRLTVLRFTGW